MLPSLPQDKANHAVYGAVIALVVLALALPVSPYAAHLALTAAVLVGVAKEIADRIANLKAQRAGLLPPHGVELADAIATAAGGVVVFISAQLPRWLT